MPDAQDRRIALLLYDDPTSSNALKARFLLAGYLRIEEWDLMRPKGTRAGAVREVPDHGGRTAPQS